MLKNDTTTRQLSSTMNPFKPFEWITHFERRIIKLPPLPAPQLPPLPEPQLSPVKPPKPPTSIFKCKTAKVGLAPVSQELEVYTAKKQRRLRFNTSNKVHVEICDEPPPAPSRPAPSPPLDIYYYPQ